MKILLPSLLCLVLIGCSQPTTTTSSKSTTQESNTPSVQNSERSPKTQALRPTQVHHSVPFSPQAPLGNWSDPRQQDGCEEMSVLMAVHWREGTALPYWQAEQELLALADWQTETYGKNKDTSAEDTKKRLLEEYFGIEDTYIIEATDVETITEELYAGHLVLAPMQGQRLENPFFTAPGPETHMIVISGYDPDTKEFITHDPGTKRGKDFRYQEDIILDAIWNYPTNGKEASSLEKAVIVVPKPSTNKE